MTMQALDHFWYKESHFWVNYIEFPSDLFCIRSFGLEPDFGASTDCYRGFVTTYSVVNNYLFLKELFVYTRYNPNKPPPAINNTIPQIEEFPKGEWNSLTSLKLKYKNIDMLLQYTGSIMVSTFPVQSVNGFFEPLYCYAVVIQFTFKDGLLISVKDHSLLAKSLREKDDIKIKEYLEISNLDDWTLNCFGISNHTNVVSLTDLNNDS